MPEEILSQAPTPLESEAAKDDVLSELLKFAELSDKDKAKLIRKYTKDPNEKNAAYYHRKYADQLLPNLESLIPAPIGSTLFFSLEDHAPWKLNTLKMYIVHGYSYIMDNMDPDNRFRQLRACVEIRVREDGIRIVKLRPSGPEPKLRPRFLSPEEAKAPTDEDPLMTEVKNWMQTATIKGATFKRPLGRENFSLTDAQVNKWNALFETLEEFGGVASKSSLLVRRIM